MKNILIIGGSKGIGAAIIEELKSSCNIINISRSFPKEINGITHYSLDVLTDSLPDIDSLDGLVYCPGSINLKTLSRLSLEDFENDFRINVLGAIKVLKHYEKSLMNAEGSVVLFSTVATRLGMPFHSSIAVSKSAIEGLAKSLAAEHATKVRYNVIAPTVTNTELATRLLRTEKQQDSIKNRHPLKKYLQPSEVASLATYLLSNHSSAISGQVFPLDAGITTLKL
ncbi:SDR family NAD(P)-dependent oxidoreductase [Pseudofulvibacter geojedonensis]|uniref:SDR family NAD(P)-dependent oxidoreductase n=1 Tax=Pseudofulvibacter geojedonensis TaxID=1123758 RepID=A0ABW3I284_9FLAO